MSVKIERAAVAAANESNLPVVTNQRRRLTWVQALAAAPWPCPRLPASAEQRYREGFARALVQRGIAREAGEWGGVGGAHAQAQLLIRADAEEIDGFRKAAKTAGKTLKDWILERLRGRVAKG